MKHSYLTKIFCVFCIALTFNANAQNKVYAGSVSAYNSSPVFPYSSYVDNVNQAVDGNLNTAATVRANSGTIAGVGSYSGYIELQFSTTLTANTTSYVKLRTDDNILQYLLGGSLGGLLADVAGSVLSGNQQFNVSVKNGSTEVLSGQSWEPSDFSGPELRVVYNSAGEYFLRITPQSSYNRIRITNILGSLIGANTVKTIDVYEAFYISGSAECGIGTYTSYNSSGVSLNAVELGGATAANPHYAIDADLSNYSHLNIGVLGVTASVQQTAYFEGPSSASDYYRIKFSVPSNLIAVNILDRITVTAHYGNTQVATYSMSSLVDEELLELLNSGQAATVSIAPGIADRITVSIGTLAGVAVEQSLNLYCVIKGNLGVSVTGGGSYQVGSSPLLTASVTSCNSPFTYSWSNGLGSTSSTASPPSDTAGTYPYTVTVTDAYGTTETATAEVVIEAPPVGGSITGKYAACEGYEANDMQLTDYTGTVEYWEVATLEDFSDAVQVNITDDVLPGSEIGIVSGTIYIRALVGNFTYDPVYSSVAEIAPKETSWLGTAWSNGVPDINTAIIFEAAYNESDDLYGCNIKVINDAVVIIPSGYNVTITGAIDVISGSFKLETNSNLVQLTDAVNSGAIQIEKDSSPLYRLDYTLWSSPVTGQNVFDFSPLTVATRFYLYDEQIDNYLITSPYELEFTPGWGVLIRMPNNHPSYIDDETPGTVWTGTFEGLTNNGTYKLFMERETQGYNMVGNPYPSPINIHDFFNANASTLAPGAPLYFWRKRNDYTETTYATITKAAYVANPAPGGDTGSDTFVGDPSKWVINSGQGFFVQAVADSLEFNNSMRRAVNNGQFFRQPATESTISRLWLNIKNNNDRFFQTAVAYNEGTTTDIDFGWDGFMPVTTSPVKIYSLVDDNDLTIQARGVFSDADLVPLGIEVNESGSFSIMIDHFDGLFEEEQQIYLHDLVADVVANLSEDDYSFSANAGRTDDRFILAYKNIALSTGVVTSDDNQIIIYQKDNVLHIDAGNIQIDSVQLYDLTGRAVHSAENINETKTGISGINIRDQVLIVSIDTKNGIVNKKVMF